MKKLFVLCLLVVSVVTAFAQSPVGIWKGSMKIDRSSLPKSSSAEGEKALLKMISNFAKIPIKLTLAKGGTYTTSTPAVKNPDGSPGMPASSESGTWTQKGNVVTLYRKTNNGKAVSDPRPQPMTVSANGRKMVAIVSIDGYRGVITFNR